MMFKTSKKMLSVTLGALFFTPSFKELANN